MAFYYDYTAVLGLSAAILLIIAWAYWRVTEPYANMPTCWAVSNVLWLYLKGQIPRNISSTEFFFQYLLDVIELYKTEGLFVVWLPRPYVVILSEQGAKIFLHGEVSNDKPKKYNDMQGLFGGGLITSNGEIWMKHRKMLNPAFHTNMLKGRISTFNECAEALVKELSEVVDQSCVDIFEYLKICSFHVLFESILGLKGKNKQNEETLRVMTKTATRIAEIIAYRLFIPWWQSDFIFSLTSLGKEYKSVCDDWHNLTRKVILDMKKSAASQQPDKAESAYSTEDRKSFARILLDYSLQDSSFTLKDVEDQLKTFMSAGYDTIATTIMWCLYLLGLHPDIQEQAYNEVMSVTDEFVSYEQLCELKYLEGVIMYEVIVGDVKRNPLPELLRWRAIGWIEMGWGGDFIQMNDNAHLTQLSLSIDILRIKETLRVYPSVPLLGREVKRDVQFEKYKVPKGAIVVFCSYAHHRNPEIFPDPEKFDPDRFIGGSSGKRPYSYMPFAEGMRSCIGKRFAMLEMKVILSHVLRNFKITSLKNREDINLYWMIALMPTEPIFLQLKPRQPVH